MPDLTSVDTQDVEQVQKTLSSLTLEKVLTSLITLAVCIVVIKILLKLVDRALDHSRLDKTLHAFLRSALKILFYLIAALIVVGTLGIDVTSMVAVLSIIGLALSLAIQGSLSNLAGGIMLLTTKPFKVGDFIEVGTVSGNVREIGMFYTKIASIDNRIIFAPNSDVTASKVINYTAEARRMVELHISASYDDPVDSVKAALQEAALVPGALADPPVVVHVRSYGDSGIEYLLRVWAETETYWSVYYALQENVKRVFDAQGIHMSYPHLNVHLAQSERPAVK